MDGVHAVLVLSADLLVRLGVGVEETCVAGGRQHAIDRGSTGIRHPASAVRRDPPLRADGDVLGAIEVHVAGFGGLVDNDATDRPPGAGGGRRRICTHYGPRELVAVEVGQVPGETGGEPAAARARLVCAAVAGGIGVPACVRAPTA